MIHKIFSIHDNAAKAYLLPFFLPTLGLATRTFSDCINDDTHAFGRNPKDYTLFEIGTWNDATAEVDYLTPYENHGNGVEFLTPLSNPEVELTEVAGNGTS